MNAVENNKILLVEDNKLIQIVMSEFITMAGYSLDVAENGQKALVLTENTSYKLILMDIGLPDIDGVEVTRRIRQKEALSKRVPIVALTTSEGEELKKRCRQVGMDAFVNKPISQEALCLLIHQYTHVVRK